MTLEEDLRVTLHDRAAAAMPPADDLLTEVTLGVRRDVRRRRLVAGGAAVAVVTAALAVPLLRHDDGRHQPLPAASGSLADDWDRGSWSPAPFFSLRPTWVPADLGTRPEVLQLGYNEVLQYEKDGDVLSAETGPQEPDWGAETTGEHSADVGGRTAIVRTADDYDGAGPGDRFIAVRWKLPPSDLWVQVTSFGDHTEAEVLRFARGLDGGTGSVAGTSPAPFTFSAWPPRMTTQHQSPTQVCLIGRDQRQQRQPEGLCILVTEEPFAPGTDGERLTVAGRDAELYLDAGSLTVDLSAGRLLSVTWDPETMPLSRDDVLRFAGGITYHG
ncbi:hypothetical protein [Actinoplanes xinjiangensis]|uniref:hypothetical protein n=1 Tax=Actinoplanes xinjiangensis TaxID=512350 RepID=UPI003419AFF0